MDLLFILSGIAMALGAFLLTPWGMPLAAAGLSALRESKVLQWLLGALIFVAAILAMRRDARKQGQREALQDVQAANRQAQDRRVEIDRKAERDAEQVIRDELRVWSKGASK